MKKLLFMLAVLVSMLCPSESRAINFVSSIAVGWNKKSYKPISDQSGYKNYHDLNTDFNGGCGKNSGYVSIGYYISNIPEKAITDVIILINHDPESFVWNGRTYQRASTAFGSRDLNEEAGGDYLYLYYTRDTNTADDGSLVTEIYVCSKDDPNACKGVFKDGTSEDACDLNRGTGGNKYYLGQRKGHTHTITRWPISSTGHEKGCKECGLVQKTLKHTWKNTGSLMKTATCTSGEIRYQKCGNCNYTNDPNHTYVNGNPLPHTFDDATDPHHHNCTVCKRSFFRYQSINRSVVEPKTTDAFGAAKIISNKFDNVEGVIELDRQFTTIGDNAFNGCSDLVGELVIPEFVTSIGESAFSGCSSLSGNLEFPAKVKSIGSSAFEGCSNLTSVLFMGDKPASMASTCFGADNLTLYVKNLSQWDTNESYGANKLIYKTWKEYCEEIIGHHDCDENCVCRFCQVKHPDLEYVQAVQATCTTAGREEYWHCNDCGRYFYDSECLNPIDDMNSLVIAAGHHINAEGSCDNCDFAYPRLALGDINIHVPAAGNNNIGELSGYPVLYFYTPKRSGKLSLLVNTQETMSGAIFDEVGSCLSSSALNINNYPVVVGKLYLIGIRANNDTDSLESCKLTAKVEYDPCDNHGALRFIPELPATCTEPGRKGYWHCDDCEHDYSDQECEHSIDNWEDFVIEPHHQINTEGHCNNCDFAYPQLARGEKMVYVSGVDKYTVMREYPELYFFSPKKSGYLAITSNDKQKIFGTIFDLDGNVLHITYPSTSYEYIDSNLVIIRYCFQEGHQYLIGLRSGTDGKDPKNISINVNCDYTLCENHASVRFVPEQPATCTEPGRKRYWYCDDCEHKFWDSECKQTISDIGNNYYDDDEGYFHVDDLHIYPHHKINAEGHCENCDFACPLLTYGEMIVNAPRPRNGSVSLKSGYPTLYYFAPQQNGFLSIGASTDATACAAAFVLENDTAIQVGYSNDMSSFIHFDNNLLGLIYSAGQQYLIGIKTIDEDQPLVNYPIYVDMSSNTCNYHSSIQHVDSLPATCTQLGHKEHWVCSDCCHTFLEEACSIPVHFWSNIAIPARHQPDASGKCTHCDLEYPLLTPGIMNVRVHGNYEFDYEDWMQTNSEFYYFAPQRSGRLTFSSEMGSDVSCSLLALDGREIDSFNLRRSSFDFEPGEQYLIWFYSSMGVIHRTPGVASKSRGYYDGMEDEDKDCQVFVDIDIDECDVHNSLQHVDSVSATCDQLGSHDYWICSDCYHTYLDQRGEDTISLMNIYVEQLGHQPNAECKCERCDLQFRPFERGLHVVDIPAVDNEDYSHLKGYPVLYYFAPEQDCNLIIYPVNGEKEFISNVFDLKGNSVRNQYYNSYYSPKKASIYERDNYPYKAGEKYLIGLRAYSSNAYFPGAEFYFNYLVKPCEEHLAIQHVDSVPATCTQAGCIEHWFCPDCNHYYKDDTYNEDLGFLDDVYIHPQGHQPDAEGKCQRCDHQYPLLCYGESFVNVPAVGNSYYDDIKGYPVLYYFAPKSSGVLSIYRDWFVADYSAIFDLQGNCINCQSDYLMYSFIGGRQYLIGFRAADSIPLVNQKIYVQVQMDAACQNHVCLQHNDSVPATCTHEGYRECWFCPDCYNFYLTSDCQTSVDFLSEVRILAEGHQFATDGLCQHCGVQAPQLPIGKTGISSPNIEDRDYDSLSSYPLVYRFTPEASGSLYLSTMKDESVDGAVFDAEGTLLVWDEGSYYEGGLDLNFDFEEGKTYYVGLNPYNASVFQTMLRSTVAYDMDFQDEMEQSVMIKSDKKGLFSTDQSVVLNDAAGIKSLPDFQAQKVTYSRTMNNAWGTLILPFDIDYDPENGEYKLYYLNNVKDDRLTFAEFHAGFIPVGTPVAIKMLGSMPASFYIEEYDPTISTRLNTFVCRETGWSMSGSYRPLTSAAGAQFDPMGKNIYYIAQNQFWFANQSFDLAPFRAWFEAPASASASAKRFVIAEEGAEEEETAIQSVADMKRESVCFDLMGQPLSTPVKGLQIVNGRKVLKK